MGIITNHFKAVIESKLDLINPKIVYNINWHYFNELEDKAIKEFIRNYHDGLFMIPLKENELDKIYEHLKKTR